MTARLLLLRLAVPSLLLGCASPPKTFVRTMEPSWTQIEIQKDLPYDRAWNGVVDILAKKFDLEMVDKQNGYARTGWLYTWTGQMREDYRVRAIVKFNQDRGVCELKSEAHYGGPNSWTLGTDDLLLTTLKTDVMGVVGRVTR
ncbi:MAG: hypothetical protein L0323_00550 [Planctomycetes bacterium]|nr:hypothetical protein [Planctomycetota bacterium]